MFSLFSQFFRWWIVCLCFTLWCAHIFLFYFIVHSYLPLSVRQFALLFYLCFFSQCSDTFSLWFPIVWLQSVIFLPHLMLVFYYLHISLYSIFCDTLVISSYFIVWDIVIGRKIFYVKLNSNVLNSSAIQFIFPAVCRFNLFYIWAPMTIFLKVSNL